MPRKTSEWIAKNDDSVAPPRVRLRVYERYKGICQLSKRKIGTGEKWELHHSIALIENGENRESNLVPVLVAPHKTETKRQMAVKKKVNAQRKKHLGITQPKGKMKSRGFAHANKKGRLKMPELPRNSLFERKSNAT